MVMDPLDGNKIHHYQQNLNWDSASQKSNTNNVIEMMTCLQTQRKLFVTRNSFVLTPLL
jgi:hypothetical protein